MIEAAGLARTFTADGREVAAVRGVDLRVEAGEIVAFLGPNGAGKTTTMRMLTTLLRPTAGTARIAGADLLTEQKRVRRHIGYVAQGGGTVDERKVREELMLQARLYGLNKTDAAERVREVSGQLGLTGLEDRLTSAMSGGQRRRLDLALGMVHLPVVLFLDEPTTGLDPQSRAHLWSHIRRLRDEQGVTVFLSTHYLDEADALADRIQVIDDGVIVAEDTPEALKSRLLGDGVEVTVPPERADHAELLLGGLPGIRGLRREDATLRFQVAQSEEVLSPLVRALDQHDITLVALRVQRPTLDDVFFALTGRGLREPVKEATDAA
ncbi:ATP-binding cassette domain-containing protein [Amycolatopsis sp. FBCC-B4732]|uniref:ATP-binding cassette domain-containing protein n=1 Tax=Amycolatopsis sp. FBCC-B4732 TaxID=3079339 RepID=UPI001FF54915|nr:ATP-binding cassette domain-containing protein [Amycolatopsis sp. FBCC-B4732]UOX92942.1 ATP-binding cassette domain-containing protein [Amycolatopsis sp. FBCC-B4732]